MPLKIESCDATALAAVALPSYAGKYTAIPYSFIMDKTTEAITANGFTVKDVEFKLSDGGKVAKAIYYLQHATLTDDIVFVWNNSYNKTTKFSCSIGLYDPHSDAIYLSNKVGSKLRKHIGDANAEAENAINDQLSKADVYLSVLNTDKKIMSDLIITRQDVITSLGTLFLNDVLSTHQMSMLRTKFLETMPWNMWGLYSEVCNVLDETHPRYWMQNQLDTSEYFSKATDSKLKSLLELAGNAALSAEVVNFINKEETIDENMTVTGEEKPYLSDAPWVDMSRKSDISTGSEVEEASSFLSAAQDQSFDL